MKTLMVAVVAIAASMVAFADTVTFTWKGGDGNWSDPAMWTASDGSTDRYPNAETDYAVFSPGEKAVVTVTENVSPYDVRFTPENSDLCFKGDPDVLPLIKLDKANKIDQGKTSNWSLTFDGVKCTFGDSVWAGQTVYTYHNCKLTIKNKSEVTLYRIMSSSFQVPPSTAWIVPTNIVISVEPSSTFHLGALAMNGKNSSFSITDATLKYEGGSMDSSNNYQFYVYGDSKVTMRRSLFTKNNATFNVSLPEEPYATELVKLSDNGADYTNNYTTINILPDSPALKTSASTNRVYRIFNWHGTSAKIKNIGIDPNCLTWKYNGKNLKPYMSVESSFDPEYQAGGAKYPQYFDFVLGPKPGMMLLLR